MSKFYVGQRVRLARPFCQKNHGLTGVIRELSDEPFVSKHGTVWSRAVNCFCDWDNCLRDGPYELGFNGTACHTDQLEPLQPERNQTIAWSECVWKPEHMRAEA